MRSGTLMPGYLDLDLACTDRNELYYSQGRCLTPSASREFVIAAPCGRQRQQIKAGVKESEGRGHALSYSIQYS